MEHPEAERAVARAAHRSLDLIVGLLALAGATPILVVSAMAVWLSGDRGPIVYRAIRVGRGGRPIEVFKLRTMAVERTDPSAQTDDVARWGPPGITRHGDPRVTRVGRFLRQLKMDELPQLVNVIRGEMSLVGPRPEDPRYVDWSDPVHRFVYSVRPGLTGPSQIAFRHEELMLEVDDPEHYYRSTVLPAKLALDAEYLSRRTAASDLRMLASTIWAVFARYPPD